MKRNLWWLLLLLLVACRANPAPLTLNVIAGSELRDIEPLLPQLEEQTGVKLKLTYSGTLEGVDRLLAGERFDLAWFSHGKYLALRNPKLVVTQERLMLSPVVLGLKRSKVANLGWDDQAITWKAIAQQAEAGNLRYAMTNPAASNSGFTALLGVWAALAGQSDAATGNEVGGQALKGFFNGQVATAGSSGWLAESYIKQQNTLDGLINYESVLLSLNQGGQLREPLVLLYPSEGVVTADYPLMLLQAEQRQAFDKVVTFFKSEAVQKRIMEQTLRRPVNSAVGLSSVFPNSLIVELPFPASAQAVDTILARYFSEQRRPAHAIFVIDVSSSMQGERIAALKQSLRNLAGEDTSTAGQYARFQPRERVTLIPFSGQVNPARSFELTEDAYAINTAAIRDYVQSLGLQGSTAIYSALRQAYIIAQRELAQDPNRLYSVVLMTDGENNAGIRLDDFVSYYQRLPANVQAIHTFPILFGEGNKAEMESVAQTTGGRVVDGRSSLTKAFKEIRGYQ